MIDLVAMPKYEKYKDSGVEWIGEIPESWVIRKMKYLYKDTSVKNKPDETLLSVTQSQGVVPRAWVENRMVMPSGNLESFKFIEKGDFAISLRSFEGGLEFCHHDGIISPAYTVLKTKNENLNKNYYKYLFKCKSFISELQTSIVGIREGKNISFEELQYSSLPIPENYIQEIIANFLDQKTAQIDQAIAIKEKQIELLKERKQIIIQKAVTQGINPNVKMKDSGVDWIGEIPEHWGVKRLKFLIKSLDSGVSVNASEAESAKDNQVGVLKTSAVYSYEFNPLENKRVFDKEVKRVSCSVKAGTIIISRMNTPELVGASGYVNKNYDNLFLPDRLWQAEFYPKYRSFALFVSHVMTTKSFRGLIESVATGSSPSMKNISKDDLLRIKIPVPPLQELIQLVTYIDSNNSLLSDAGKLQQSQIKKLKEYKTTLIDSAVTGKIKITESARGSL